MKNLIVLLVVAAVVVAGIGWHQGWFSVRTTDSGNNKTDVNISIDKTKVREDVDKVKEEVKDLAGDKGKPGDKGEPAR